ncbi:MAG: PTS fructose transporter subunit IIC [Anaerolineaceae bacterium]
MKGKSFVYRDAMAGVSRFLPFSVAGCVLISFVFLLNNGIAEPGSFVAANPIFTWLYKIGGIAMGFMLPILAGYIAESIADRPGLLAGMIVGALAKDGGSGFIGAILGGFAAGYIIKLIEQITKGLPRSFEGAKTLIVFPIIGTILAALAMIPINYVAVPINTILNSCLQNLSGGNAIILGAVIGAMLSYDSGGPVNKIAYLFAVASLIGEAGKITPSIAMGAAGCAGMTISTSCALATVLFPQKFSQELKDAGKAAWIMGFSFIGEGAIPFAMEHPKEVVPSLMTGAAVAGALSGLFRLTLAAPIGGIFTVPLASNVLLYLLCFIIGTLISTFMMGALIKKHVEEDKQEEA